ncbi:MAG: imelysin family protein [bacterium]|nr:imelysin family protein [bacterium]
MKIKFILICLLFTISIGACKETPSAQTSPENGKDREALLMHYADSLIIPAYSSFQNKFDSFQKQVDNFIGNPTQSNLITLRNAWTSTYIQWQTVELFDFGPAETNTLRNFYNIYPADTNGIIANIANSGANLELPAAYAHQGFPALDYLLNGTAPSDTGIVNYFTHATSGPQRTAYLKRLTDRMNLLLSGVINEWKGAYRTTFISKTGLDLNASASLMTNGFILHYERFIRAGKIGIPSGAIVNGIAAPEKVEAYYKKDISQALLKSAHLAYIKFFNGQAFYSGNTGPSFKTYLDALGTKDQASGKLLSQIINDQLIVVDNKLVGLMPNLYQQITSNNSAMNDVYTNMQTVVRLLKVDMTSAMSITITYTDNDGD